MQNAVAITKPISYNELAGGQRIDFVQRYANFIKTKPLMRLVADENALKESIENAQRALQNAQNKDMSSVLNELNDKRARLDEIDIFLGRVEESSPAVERAKARYGDEYKQIIVDKINKESEASGQSDIVFAPQRKNFGIMSNKNDKEHKMPKDKVVADDEALKAFGENHSQFKGKGVQAFEFLAENKNGFVSGAFHRKELGDIDLVWGAAWQDDKGNIKGYGLSKIIQKHPEISAQTLNDIITKGDIRMRKNEATQIFYKEHKVLLKQNWNGKALKNKWIVTAYAKM